MKFQPFQRVRIKQRFSHKLGCAIECWINNLGWQWCPSEAIIYKYQWDTLTWEVFTETGDFWLIIEENLEAIK